MRPRTLLGESVLVALAFLVLEAIYALTAGQLAYQAPVLTHAIPLKDLVIEQWRDGTVPLWSSMVGAGEPLVADATSLPFDFRHLFLLPFSTIDGYVAATIFTRVAGAVITFCYLRRRLRASGLASFAGALVFLSSTSFFDEGTTLYTGIALFPGLIWLSERLVDSVTAIRVVALGAAWGLFMLMNSLQYVPYIAVGAFAWPILHAAFRERGFDLRRLMRFTGAYALAGLIGVSLAAIALLPALELASESNRGGEYPSESYAGDSLTAAVGIPQPSGLGYPLGSYYLYVGVISLAVIPIAIRFWRNPYVRAAVALGLGAGSIVLLGFLSKPSLVDVFPTLATLSFARATFLIGFAAAVLVAVGLSEWSWRLGPKAGLAVGALFAIQVCVLIAIIAPGGDSLARLLDVERYSELDTLLNPIFPAALVVVLIGVRALGLGAALLYPSGRPGWMDGRLRGSRSVIVGTLLVIELALAWGIARPMTPQRGYPTTAEHRFLEANTGANLRAMEIMVRPEWAPVVPGPKDLSLHQNAPAYYGIPTTNVYSSLISEDYSDTFDDFGDSDYRRSVIQNAPNSTMQTTRYDSPLVRALGVGYIYSFSELPNPRLSRLAFAGSGYYIYEVMDPLPRAFFAGRALWRPRDEVHQELRSLGANRPDAIALGPEIVLEGETRDQGKPAYAEAEVISDSGSAVEVSVRAPRSGFLVLSDVDLPGWSAEVDGRSTEIHKANGYARAVRVPAGAHTVEFRYRPSSVDRGVILSGAALALCLGVVGTAGLRRARGRS